VEVQVLVNLPRDADGDVIRKLAKNGVDLNVEHVIDFEIDLDTWPPNPQLVEALRQKFSTVNLIEPQDGFEGYINIKVKKHVTYDYVIGMQSDLSSLAAPYGGRCNAWGVWSGT
jgi:hypothetical protein